MATLETEVKLTDHESEPLTSVTQQENFGLPDGHEIDIVNHSTDHKNTEEAVVNAATVAFSDKDGHVIAIAANATESTTPDDQQEQVKSTIASDHDKTAVIPNEINEDVQKGCSTVDEAATPKLPTDVNGLEGSEQHNSTEADQPTNSATNCLVDNTSRLVKSEEPVITECATLDDFIQPDQPEVGPTVFRPKRPPPPKEVPSQIKVDVQPTLHTSPPVPQAVQGREETRKNSKSLNRVRSFGASMLNVFTNMKGSIRRKRTKKGTRMNPPGVASDGHLNGSTPQPNRMIIEGGIETESMHSSTLASNNSSAINTPQFNRKKEAIQQALPDLLTAMQPDSPELNVHVGNVEGQPQSQVLGWTAQSISADVNQMQLQGETVIQPMQIPRDSAQRGLLAQMHPVGATHTPPPVRTVGIQSRLRTSPQQPQITYSAAPQRVSLRLSKEDPVVSSGLTSLQSERVNLLQLSMKGSQTEITPVSHQDIHSQRPPNQTTSLPYLSNSLAAKTDSLHNDINVAVKNCLEEVHPFLVILNCPEGMEAKEADHQEAEESREMAMNCLQNYLATCTKLRSVDLQGQFAPFHYQLKHFSGESLVNCAVLEDCREVNILREPKWNTDYVELADIEQVSAPQQKLFYATLPIDTLLTTWLDCHKTVRTSTTNTVKTAGKCVYHPVQIVARLDQVLGLCENIKLLHHCLRLAVLLTYNYVKQYYGHLQCNLHLDTEAKHILLLMSTCDCLVIFIRKEDAEESGATGNNVDAAGVDSGEDEDKKVSEVNDKQTASETDQATKEEQQVEGNSLDPEQVTLLKDIKCAEYTTDEEAIDGVISEIRQCAESQLSTKLLAAPLMRAIAPPDWIAMTLARVCISKQ